MSTLFWLIASHFVCDYPLQSDFIAVGKNPAKSPYNGVPWYWIMLSHAFTHGAGVGLVTGNAGLGFAETVAHFAIDWLKCKGYTNIFQELHPMVSIYTDASYRRGKARLAWMVVADGTETVYTADVNAFGNMQAEVMAITRAVGYVVDNHWRTESIYLYTDCQTLVPFLNGERSVLEMRSGPFRRHLGHAIAQIRNRLQGRRFIVNYRSQYDSNRIREVDRAASLRTGNPPRRPPVDRWDDDRVYGEPSPC